MVEGREMRGRECRGERMLKDSIKDKCLWRSAASCISSILLSFYKFFFIFLKLYFLPLFFSFFLFLFSFLFALSFFLGGQSSLCRNHLELSKESRALECEACGTIEEEMRMPEEAIIVDVPVG